MKQLIILLLTALIGLGSYAQDRIDRVIADLESKNDVETTYSERRTAKKHKLYRITTVLNFNKDEYYKRLAKAFEDEREKAVSAVKTRTSHSYRFTDDKGTSTYTLTRNSIVKSWRSNEDKSDDESNVETIVDPNGNTLVTITTNNKKTSQARREEARVARDVARAEARGARETARQEREIARKEARVAREVARQQREIARKEAQVARDAARGLQHDVAQVDIHF